MPHIPLPMRHSMDTNEATIAPTPENAPLAQMLPTLRVMLSKHCASCTPLVMLSAPFPCGRMCTLRSNTMCNTRRTKRTSHLDSTASWMPHTSVIDKGNDVRHVALGMPIFGKDCEHHLPQPHPPTTISPSSLLSPHPFCTVLPILQGSHGEWVSTVAVILQAWLWSATRMDWCRCDCDPLLLLPCGWSGHGDWTICASHVGKTPPTAVWPA